MQKDDVIYRQAAIDAVSRGCEELRGIFAECEKNLNELPSAQMEPTLKQIEEYCRKRCLSIVDNALLYKYAQAEIQPEIIHCRNCKYGSYELARPNKYHPGDAAFPAHWRCYYYKNFIPIVSPDDFCSRAERRTDGRD